MNVSIAKLREYGMTHSWVSVGEPDEVLEGFYIGIIFIILRKCPLNLDTAK